MVDLIRYIMGGGPEDRQVQYLLTWVHNGDADKSGLFTFNELLVTLRAVPVEYPGGKIEASTFEPPATGSVGDPFLHLYLLLYFQLYNMYLQIFLNLYLHLCMFPSFIVCTEFVNVGPCFSV